MTSISRLLVANRGEIARRVFATCRRLGIETVAVHSDADADLPFVHESDRAVRLPGNTPAETYLRVDLVVAAARAAGADAVHPGYGFLSENADFARAVQEAGLVWVGPDPAAIEAMGSKIGAKEIMRAAGVPVLEAPEQPTEADLPLLVKASSGGGGRGMRVVRQLSDLADEQAAASAEAGSAFGDGTVFVEPYVESGRHVEVQVVGDAHGTVLVLGDRDCTVQRRHQKVVEEAPAPGLPDEVRAALHDAARRAAEALDYRGAGTVEFLYEATSGRFWFLEMNTRLQVEHPVTELVHGVDLVALQLGVAEGGALPELEEAPGPVRGHAVEVRLYAEDDTWTPQSGTLVECDLAADFTFDPFAANRARTGVRADQGFAAGNRVGTHYDPMLAKVIAWGPTRDRAVRRLVQTLRRARIHGLATNREQLLSILTDRDFVDMSISTTWLEERPPVEETPGLRVLDAVAAAVMSVADTDARRSVQQRVPIGWRNVVSQPQRTRLVDRATGLEIVVDWWGTRDGIVVDHPATEDEAGHDVRVLDATPTRVRLEVDGVGATWTGQVLHDPATGGREVWLEGPARATAWTLPPRFRDPSREVAAGALRAPMPGSVLSVAVAVGDTVDAGQTLVVMEAMKMQHTLTAPAGGLVTALPAVVGQQVVAGAVLAVLEPA